MSRSTRGSYPAGPRPHQGDGRRADRGAVGSDLGSAQFSIHGPEWTAIAASKGAPVDIIANVVNGAAVWIATAPDFKFDSIKDVKGQKVVTGLMPTTSTSLFIKLLKVYGTYAKTDVEMIQVADRLRARTFRRQAGRHRRDV